MSEDIASWSRPIFLCQVMLHSFIYEVLTFLLHCEYLRGASQVALVVKNPTANTGDPDLFSESGGSPGVGNDTQLQYSCLEGSMGRGAWLATAHGVTGVRPS